ncbi:O-antigen polymerase [Winogradskyella psychrotolerans]|uniref:O-antigen polymerase n=1 Tax=Winogradskyella psychrotolerans TaxID=1344585 RepID=UPI001C07EAFE|nr:O-antigen polymerase [Winogradskyella psychrotolerans]MBU2927581.1 oligosaccharide repeat unit polymerase [Winogradskyella psychrotolerans]
MQDYFYISLAFLIFVFFYSKKKRKLKYFSFSFIGPLIIFLQYFASYFESILKGHKYESNILRSYNIEVGLTFALLSILAFFIGFNLKKEKFRLNSSIDFSINLFSNRILYLVLIFTLIFTLVILGGIQNALFSIYDRGDWNNMLFAFSPVVVSTLMVASTIIFPIIILYAATGIVLKPKSKVLLYCIGAAASITFWYEFSRGSGIFFMLIPIADYLINKKIKLSKFILLFTISMYLSFIGFTQRKYYKGGVANYIYAVFQPKFDDQSRTIFKEEFKPVFASIDALPSFTVKVDDKHNDQETSFSLLFKLLYNLNPFPQFIMKPYPIGKDLKDMIGVDYGITTPALAEIYYVMNYFGVVLVFCIGYLFSYFERNALNQNQFILVLTYVFLLIALVLSSHSGLRPVLKIIWYLVLFKFFLKKIGVVN